MLIDQFLPEFEFADTSRIEIKASSAAAFRAVKNFDLAKSTTVRWLLKMRGAKIEKLTLADLERANFGILGEKLNEELALGFIGEFKTLTSGLLKIMPENFKNFNQPGFVKAVWNFAIAESKNARATITSEIRIHGTNAESAAKVQKSWGIVKPPTAMIRSEILQMIKAEAESEKKQ